jgi:glycerol-3-phosphate acyltransferase PlsY
VHPATGLLIAYLLGSVPAAYIAGRLGKGIDLRQHGSGNLGATNVYRVLGWKVAAAVLLFDAAKGALPVLFFPQWFSAVPAAQWAIAYGIAAIVGHVRPIFLLWKGGGKGVATAAGVFLALAPVPMGIALGVWIAVLLVSGYVSLASLISAALLAVLLVVMQGIRSPMAIVGVALALFVFYTHRANIGRLRRGEEHRFGKKATT